MASDTSTDGSEREERQIFDGEPGDDWGKRFGWFYSPETECVYNPQDGSSGPIIVTKNGEIEERYIQRAMSKVGRGEGMLWGRLGPVKIDGIEIRRNTQLWHEERECWLLANSIDLITDPDVQPKITFKIKGSWPVTRLTYSAEMLEDMREDGIIESQREVNDKAENLLEEFRENCSVDTGTDRSDCDD